MMSFVQKKSLQIQFASSVCSRISKWKWFCYKRLWFFSSMWSHIISHSWIPFIYGISLSRVCVWSQFCHKVSHGNDPPSSNFVSFQCVRFYTDENLTLLKSKIFCKNVVPLQCTLSHITSNLISIKVTYTMSSLQCIFRYDH